MGLRLTELYREKRQKYMGIEDPEAFAKVWATLSHEERTQLQGKALDFVEAVCRRLGETSAGDQRIALLLVEWAESSKEYAAFDVLLTEFGDFDQRARVLRLGLRLFPTTLTAHWQ